MGRKRGLFTWWRISCSRASAPMHARTPSPAGRSASRTSSSDILRIANRAAFATSSASNCSNRTRTIQRCVDVPFDQRDLPARR